MNEESAKRGVKRRKYQTRATSDAGLRPVGARLVLARARPKNGLGSVDAGEDNPRPYDGTHVSSV